MKPILLYVEDDELSREIMALCIDELPEYDLIIFADSADFMERVSVLGGIPALILLDIHVQPNSGFQMLEMLRANELYREVPVLAVTASVMNEEISRLKTAGFNGAIAKPIDQDQLPHHLEQIRMGNEVWSIISHVQ